MKKLFTLTAIAAFSFFAHSQKTQPAVVLPSASLSTNLGFSTNDLNGQVAAINQNLQYYARNYNTIFTYSSSGFYNVAGKDNFGDFYQAYNNWSSSNYRDPIIRNMPPPGPNLDYNNVNRNLGGLFDVLVK